MSEPAVELSGIRVVIADDHAPTATPCEPPWRHGGCEVCADGAAAYDAVELAKKHEPDVVILDIHMPGNGIQAARQIAEQLPQTAIVMLTASQEDEDLFDALRAGASGYLLKGTSPLELPMCSKRVLAGEAAMPPALVSRILDEFRAPPRLFSRKSECRGQAEPARTRDHGAAGGRSVDRGRREEAVRLGDNGPRSRLLGAPQAAGQGP